ncbi:FAD binding domain-containing protein [Colletotrichum salicis]|uniref:FAD binding domain-containing protein n=1 Tax=Colletotrichum salicis TaxID=1209931 RepID=A0A135V8M2_9PEZI|nr:FAD binding domain-containing protein [Colletotrichum salicis]
MEGQQVVQRWQASDSFHVTITTVPFVPPIGTASKLVAGSSDATGHPYLQRRSSASSAGCSITCEMLVTKFPNQVYLGATNGTDYVASREGFWSTIQGDVSPSCFFRPLGATEVSVALKDVQSTGCQFAVKSGGHYSYTASTIEGGLVIDLIRLNGITLSEDKSSVISGVTLPGGRMFGVGVGGLTLGGGVSWLSNRYGLTYDNVIEFEVVLANSKIVTASTTPNPDLYWALRGGGSNFGVVTKFKFNTFPQEKMRYEKLRYNATENITANAAFADWGTVQSPKDLSNAAVLSWNAQASGSPIGVAILVHQKTFDNTTPPPVVDKFYDSPPSAIEPTNIFHADIAENLLFPASVLRSSLWNTSFVLDADLLQVVFEIWNEEASALASISIQQIQIQAIAKSQLKLVQRNGGNPHGLGGQPRPLGFVNVWSRWQNVKDDDAIYRAQQRMEERTNKASQFQDPFAGYGQDNKYRLRSISQTYDPTGVFQELSPGGFKVTKGAPQTI